MSTEQHDDFSVYALEWWPVDGNYVPHHCGRPVVPGLDCVCLACNAFWPREQVMWLRDQVQEARPVLAAVESRRTDLIATNKSTDMKTKFTLTELAQRIASDTLSPTQPENGMSIK